MSSAFVAWLRSPAAREYFFVRHRPDLWLKASVVLMQEVNAFLGPRGELGLAAGSHC